MDQWIGDLVQEDLERQRTEDITHTSPSVIEKYTVISRLSVKRRVKRKGLKKVKQLKSQN